MDDPLYSIEQIAERLGLHVKTVRNYVRDGRLKAVRIGKQYRIAAADLAAMIGQPASVIETEPAGRTRHSEVYAVAEIDAVSPALSDRITNVLLGALKSRTQSEEQPLHVQAIYDAPRAHLKVILIGSIDTTTSLLKVVKALVEVEK